MRCPGAPASWLHCAAASARRARGSGRGRQVGGSPEEGRRRRQAPARLGATGRPLQLRGNRFVQRRSCVCEMPRPAVGVGLEIGRLGESPMCPLAILRRCRPVNGRAHERMTESHPAAELDEPRRRRRFRRIGCHAQGLGRMPDDQGIADRLRRCDEQELRAARGKSASAAFGSSPRCDPRAPRRGEARTHRPARRVSAHAGAPSAPAGYRASR